MNARDTSVPRQLARIKGAPPLVLWLTQEVGCWVVGSRADFTLDRVTPTSDWDILVPWPLWEHVIGALPLESVIPTRRGGWRIRRTGQPDIDVFPGEVGEWLKISFVRVAWHPKSATVIEKVCEPTPPALDESQPVITRCDTMTTRRLARPAAPAAPQAPRSTPIPVAIPRVEALYAGLTYVHEAAKAAGRDVAVIGGLAMQHLGSPRFTGDIDIIADKRFRPFTEGQPLSVGGITVNFSTPNSETGETVQVDIIVPDEMPDPDEAELYRDALHYGVRNSATGFAYVRPEYLLTMKLSAGREKDLSDVRWLLAYGEVDMSFAHGLVKKHLGRYASGVLRDTAEEAVWARSRGKL